MTIEVMKRTLNTIINCSPNGGTFTVTLARKASRRELVSRRDYSFNGQSAYWYATDYDLLGRPTNATDSVSLSRDWLYNSRSELAATTLGTNLYGYAYDTIGNRQWSAANSATNEYSANHLNQYTMVERTASGAPPAELYYDADGNLEWDDSFAYSYDAENRLTTVSPVYETNGVARVINAYDHLNRRVRKTVQRLSVTVAPAPSPPIETRVWNTVETHTFVWDGDNIVLEKVEFANGMARTFEYFWGLDKSGTEQGAGGVGGLLAMSVDGVFYIPCYDHNGNIVRYMSETGVTAAQYMYDPYGNIVETSGPLADVFSFGFSTKYHDRETRLVHYLMRFYRPDFGCWLNRDPIEEEGGENLYAFCLNNPIRVIDIIGLGTWIFAEPSPYKNEPDFAVSYEMDKSEQKCCKAIKVYRYVRKFITGGQIGPYVLDSDEEDFIEGFPKAYTPDDWPEGPGIGNPFTRKVYYRFSWSWDFKFEVKCTKGAWQGRLLSVQKKLYFAEGHRVGDDSFNHGFLDVPPYWPDLTLPTVWQ